MAFKPRKAEITGKKHIEANQKMPYRVMIATPAYDGKIDMDYAMSITESAHIAPVFGIHVTATILKNGAFIDLARNRLTKLFLDSDCTHLFFIDADLRWEHRAFVGLVTSGLPICAGVYPKRQTPEEYPARFAIDPVAGEGIWVSHDGSTDHDKICDAGWIMCERVPTGFLCISREVIEAMVAKSPKQMMLNEGEQPLLFAATYFRRGENNEFLPVDLVNEEFKPTDPVDFIGEDFYFSDRYVKMFGKPIPVWPEFDFVHGERWEGNWHKYLVNQAEANVAMEERGEISDSQAMRWADKLRCRGFDPMRHMKPEYRKMTKEQFEKEVLIKYLPVAA